MRTCPVCTLALPADASVRAIYCSPKCSKWAANHLNRRPCSVEGCNRPHRSRGYCSPHYNEIVNPDRHRRTKTCEECRTVYITTRENGRFCSVTCSKAEQKRQTAARPRPKRPAFDRQAYGKAQRSALRAAVEDGDHAAVLLAIREHVTLDDNECWNWLRIVKDGYPVAILGKRQMYVHRLALEARLGAPLGTQPAHHVCANTVCVNPDHLQPVTHRENVAEMMARTYMVGRIAALEAALARLDPGHQLLAEIGLPSPT